MRTTPTDPVDRSGFYTDQTPAEYAAEQAKRKAEWDAADKVSCELVSGERFPLLWEDYPDGDTLCEWPFSIAYLTNRDRYVCIRSVGCESETLLWKAVLYTDGYDFKQREKKTQSDTFFAELAAAKLACELHHAKGVWPDA